MIESNSDQEERSPTWRAALFGSCPVCDAPTLFDGPVHFADRCSACGADFSGQNVGDGPAAFLTMIICAVVIALAMVLEVYVHPPFLVHVAIWVPFTIVAVLGGLRVAKGALFQAEWFRSAREGQLAAKEIEHD